MSEGVEFLPLDDKADKRLAQYIKYNGEKEIFLTLQSSRSAPMDYYGGEEYCTLRFFFVPTEESKKNPPVMNRGEILIEKRLADVTIKPVRSNYSISMNLP